MNPLIEKFLKAQIRSEKSIKKKCPHLFVTDVFIDIGPGWMPILDKLCRKLEKLVSKEKNKEEFFITEITQSFGTLLVRMSRTTPKMDDLLELAEDESEMTCDTCGEKGDIINKYGVLRVSCNDCRV